MSTKPETSSRIASFDAVALNATVRVVQLGEKSHTVTLEMDKLGGINAGDGVVVLVATEIQKQAQAIAAYTGCSLEEVVRMLTALPTAWF